MDRYIPCAYCNILIPVGSLTAGIVECRFCPKPTIITEAYLQAGEPSSTSSTSIRPPPPEAPFDAEPPLVAEPAPRNFHSRYHQFMKEETERLIAAHPERTQQQALTQAAKNWASDGYDWMQQQGRQ